MGKISKAVSLKAFEDVLHALKRHATQEQLEELLGLSNGYFSRLKHYKQPVRRTIYLFLYSLAQDPERRLDELQSLGEREVLEGR